MTEQSAGEGGLDEPVHLSEWNPNWARHAEVLAQEVASALQPPPQLEHIGSTAVQGLLAKPIIDLMVGAANVAEQEEYAWRLSQWGWQDMGEAGVPGRRHLRRRSGDNANVHIVLLGSSHWLNNIATRDFLKAHSTERAAYSEIKATIVAHGAERLLPYSHEKAAYVAALVERARAWHAAADDDR